MKRVFVVYSTFFFFFLTMFFFCLLIFLLECSRPRAKLHVPRNNKKMVKLRIYLQGKQKENGNSLLCSFATAYGQHTRPAMVRAIFWSAIAGSIFLGSHSMREVEHIISSMECCSLSHDKL